MNPVMTEPHRSNQNQSEKTTTCPKVMLSDPLQYINPAVINSRLSNPNLHSGLLNIHNNNNNAAIKKPPNQETYKTVMCQAWLESAKCQFGENCKFAHGEQELRPMKTQIRNAQKYKTKLCEKYTTTGICPYGNRCLFIHPDPRDPLHQQFFHLSQLAQMALQQLKQSHEPRSYEFPSFHPPSSFIGNLHRRMSYPVTPFSNDIWLYNNSSPSDSTSSRASLNTSPMEKLQFNLPDNMVGPKFGRGKSEMVDENSYDPFMFENDSLARDMVNILKIE